MACGREGMLVLLEEQTNKFVSSILPFEHAPLTRSHSQRSQL